MNLKGMEFTWIAWSAIEGLSLEVDDLGLDLSGDSNGLQQEKMVLNRFDLKTLGIYGQFWNKITFIP
jgi:hypothetical protein